MNAQELFEHLVYKNVEQDRIYLIFLNLSLGGKAYASWDDTVWEILSYNNDDVSVMETSY